MPFILSLSGALIASPLAFAACALTGAEVTIRLKSLMAPPSP